MGVSDDAYAMKISFDPDFDGGAWPGPLGDRDAVAGEDWLGELGLVERHCPRAPCSAASPIWSSRLVLLDHKSFPGSRDQAAARAETYAGQLSAYAAALEAAMGTPVVRSFVHLPVSGLVVRSANAIRARPVP